MPSSLSKEPLRQSRTPNSEEQLENESQGDGFSQKESLLKSTSRISGSSSGSRVPQVNSTNILRLQRTLGNQAVQRLIKNQKAVGHLSASQPSAATIIQREGEDDEDAQLLAHLNRPVGPLGDSEAPEAEDDEDAFQVEPSAPAPEPEGRQTSPTESALNSVKHVGSSFSSGLNVAVSAEKLGAPALESTTVLVGAKTTAKDTAKGLAMNGRQEVMDHAVQPAVSGAKSVAHSAVSGIRGGGHSSSGGDSTGLFAQAWHWLKDNGGKAVDWLTEHIHELFTDYLEPVMIAVGLDFATLVKAVKDLRDRLKLRSELAAQANAIEPDAEKTDLNIAIQHSYGKVRRSVITGFIGIINSIIGIVGRLITIFSGGVAAIAGESLTILKNIVSMAQKAFRAIKGVYKYVRGTKGKNRAISARTFLTEAAGGSIPAAKVIQKMDLWGKVQQAKGVKGEVTRAGNAILKAISEKPKDASGAAEIITILESQYKGADPKVQKVVEDKVAGNLKSS